ncbi:PA3371 family protein [Pseudomonas sp.]|uniref:PA3371 family protein n=1 Tax=Pseudomonas sp. TaxID=306 RepID=UPI003D6E3505
MSKPAWLFLYLTLSTALTGLCTHPHNDPTTAFIASAVFGSLLILTLIRGRRIKFDPILR